MNTKELVKREEMLLNDWAKVCPGMVKDGIVNVDEYLKAQYKILFLLKEVNGGKDWDLREFLRKGGRKQTWNNVARWVKGILTLEKDISCDELENITDDERKEMLQKIASVNVKKVSGSYTSISSEIKDAARENALRLRKQIDLYDPDILICGGTEGRYFDEISEYEPKWEMTSRGIWYVVEPTERIVISYAHPEARVKDCLLYYGIVDAVREIVKARNLHICL